MVTGYISMPIVSQEIGYLSIKIFSFSTSVYREKKYVFLHIISKTANIFFCIPKQQASVMLPGERKENYKLSFVLSKNRHRLLLKCDSLFALYRTKQAMKEGMGYIPNHT